MEKSLLLQALAEFFLRREFLCRMALVHVTTAIFAIGDFNGNRNYSSVDILPTSSPGKKRLRISAQFRNRGPEVQVFLLL